jgi:hypothetical protein
MLFPSKGNNFSIILFILKRKDTRNKEKLCLLPFFALKKNIGSFKIFVAAVATTLVAEI